MWQLVNARTGQVLFDAEGNTIEFDNAFLHKVYGNKLKRERAKEKKKQSESAINNRAEKSIGKALGAAILDVPLGIPFFKTLVLEDEIKRLNLSNINVENDGAIPLKSSPESQPTKRP